MVGDIEAANGLPSETICAHYEHLLKEVCRTFPWARIVLSGLPQTGSNFRQNIIRKVNCYLEAVAQDERLVEYVCNKRAKLRDNIHLSHVNRFQSQCINVNVKQLPSPSESNKLNVIDQKYCHHICAEILMYIRPNYHHCQLVITVILRLNHLLLKIHGLQFSETV